MAGLILGHALTVAMVIAVALFVWVAIMLDRLGREILEHEHDHDHGTYALAWSGNQANLGTQGPLPLTRV